MRGREAGAKAMSVRGARKDYKGTTRAVLTGDLVGSSELTVASLNAARNSVADALSDVEGWREGLVGAKPEFFRGDSWQALLTDPKFFLRAMIYVRARLKASGEGWDTRVAVGLGRVERIDKKRTSLSSGEAFTLSGRALDDIGGFNMAVAMPLGIARFAEGLEPLTHICGILVDDWSQKQAKTAYLALEPSALTQAEMAERLGVSQQSVSKTLAAARIPALLNAITHCEKLNWSNRVDLI